VLGVQGETTLWIVEPEIHMRLLGLRRSNGNGSQGPDAVFVSGCSDYINSCPQS
jgi:hypothetical protein